MLGTKQSNSAKSAPISKHPAFPAVVALWFAALLGFGTMVMPAALFESAVTSTGVSSVIESAAPPLGFTARLIIAVTAALIGAAVGIFVARRVADAQAPVHGRTYQAMRANTEEAEGDEPARAPISAHEELGSECLDEPVEAPEPAPTNYGGRRRALAVTDDSGTSDFLESAPLPGGDAAFDEHSENETQPEPVEEEGKVEPLELAELAMDDTGDEPAVDPHIAAPFDEPDYSGEPTAAARPFDAPDSVAADLVAEATDFEALKNAVAAPIEREASEQTGMNAIEEEFEMHDTPSDFGGSSYNPFADRSDDEFDAEQSHGFVEKTQEAPVAVPVVDQPELNSPVNERPLHELGVAELVERFALALQTKADTAVPVVLRAQPEATDDTASAEPETPEADEPAPSPMVFRRAGSISDTPLNPGSAPAMPEAEPESIHVAATASAEAFAPPPPTVPDALRPFDSDEIEESDAEDSVPDLSLSFAPRPFGKPAEAHAFGLPADDLDEEGSDEDAAYSSLLSMKSELSAGQDSIRIEDEEPQDPKTYGHEPAVIFPGQEQQRAGLEEQQATTDRAPRPFDAPHASPATGPTTTNKPAANASDTERALREALEKLQKMSGAA